MSIQQDFPNRYVNKVATAIMLDDTISKLLYYKDDLNKDILKMPSLDNPISELKDKQVFVNRRVGDLFKQGVFDRAEVFIFIDLYSDSPVTIGRGTSKFFSTLRVDIGVICANSIRNTLNGAREIAIYDRIIEIMKNTDYLQGVGEPIIKPTKHTYQIPYNYISYITTTELDYFTTW